MPGIGAVDLDESQVAVKRKRRWISCLCPNQHCGDHLAVVVQCGGNKRTANSSPLPVRIHRDEVDHRDVWALEKRAKSGNLASHLRNEGEVGPPAQIVFYPVRLQGVGFVVIYCRVRVKPVPAQRGNGNPAACGHIPFIPGANRRHAGWGRDEAGHLELQRNQRLDLAEPSGSQHSAATVDATTNENRAGFPALPDGAIRAFGISTVEDRTVQVLRLERASR